MTARPNIAQLPNPYDFSHPVSDPEIFSGRQEVIDEIRYYLDHASIDARPMNLAILGPRAAGKTSLLNMIALEGESRNYCIARVNLNESDTQSELTFFYKLFDAVLNSAIEVTLDTVAGSELAFGGRDGSTYEAYLDQTTTYVVPENRRLRPFVFPTVYAKAMAAGNLMALVSEDQLSRDLRLIQSEVDRPIVVLIDEGNVLAESRILLQKLRNIFMHLTGYMLAVTGTPELFPAMDEVFSPIARDFKRFYLGRFESANEAEECVTKPLITIGIEDAESWFDRETFRDLIAPQGLAEANPYQIQLICHFLFRNIQQGKSDIMRLNIDVLDGVLNELGQGQVVRESPIISEIRRLSDDELASLGRLCGTSGKATLEQIHSLVNVILHERPTSIEQLSRDVDHFASKGLVTTNDGNITFTGDQRETLYAKYYAKKRGVDRLVSDIDPGLLVAIGSQLRFVSQTATNPIAGALASIDSSLLHDSYLHELATSLFVGPIIKSAELGGPRWLERVALVEFYVYALQHIANNDNSIDIGSVSIVGPWINREIGLHWGAGDGSQLEDITGLLAELNAKSRTFGISFSLNHSEYPLADVDGISARVFPFVRDGEERAEIASMHAVLMQQQYVIAQDTQRAFMHQDWVERFSSTPEMQALNPVGYVHLSRGNWERSSYLLRAASASAADRHAKALIKMNQGVLCLINENAAEASSHFLESIELCESSSEDQLAVGCLIVPRTIGTRLLFVEEWEPNLLESAIDGLRSARALANGYTEEVTTTIYRSR